MAWAADSIKQTASGRFVVSDPATRQAILNLRSDPTAASLMAAEHASDNKDALAAKRDCDVTGTDLYMAHFLGLGGASKFLSAMDGNADRPAASLFPAARAPTQSSTNATVRRGRSAKCTSVSQTSSTRAQRHRVRPAWPAPRWMRSRSIRGWKSCSAPRHRAATANGWPRRSTGLTSGGRGATRTADATNLLRPNPQNARLAYLMLAQLGGNV